MIDLDFEALWPAPFPQHTRNSLIVSVRCCGNLFPKRGMRIAGYQVSRINSRYTKLNAGYTLEDQFPRDLSKPENVGRLTVNGVLAVSALSGAAELITARVAGGVAAGAVAAEKSANIVWPKNGGFLGEAGEVTLQRGTVIDRYGPSSGRYASPVGTSFEMRSLPAQALDEPYVKYKVMKPVKVKSGKVAPWFGQPGMGIQYKFVLPIKELIKNGTLKVVK